MDEEERDEGERGRRAGRGGPARERWREIRGEGGLSGPNPAPLPRRRAKEGMWRLCPPLLPHCHSFFPSTTWTTSSETTSRASSWQPGLLLHF